MGSYIQYRWRYVKYEGSVSVKLFSDWSEWFRSTEESGLLILPGNTYGFQMEYQVRIEVPSDAE